MCISQIDKSSRSSSLCSAILFASTYSIMALALSGPAPPNFYLFVACFGLLGAGTVASYLAAITAAAKSFPLYPGLAIGIPSALLGVSPLLLSNVGSALFTRMTAGDGGEIDIARLFTFFAVLLGCTNALSALALRPIIPNLDETKAIEETDPILDESEPLVSSVALHAHINVKSLLNQSIVWIFLSIFILLKYAEVPSFPFNSELSHVLTCFPFRCTADLVK